MTASRRCTAVITASILGLGTMNSWGQERWRHDPPVSGPAGQQQLNADNGRCTAVAYQTIGAPPSQPQKPAETRIELYSGPLGGSATVTPNAGGNPFYEAYTQSGRDSEYRTALANVYYGCMADRGWTLLGPSR